MAKNLSTLYPGKITVDGNNPNGTFKNRTSDILKDGTPYEFGWTSDVWGFLSHILGLASVSPSGAEENETNSQYYDALDGLLGRRKVNFESQDLIINVQSVTTVDADATRLSLLDSSFIPKFINNLNVTWTMPTNLEAGTSEKASTDYGLWVDSDLNLILVPDLESTTDGTTAGKLLDSAATFLTDLVHAGDIVYNLTDLTQTTVSVDATFEGEVSLTDDIFVSGEDYKIVKMSPTGLGANRERVGTAFNNSGSDLDDSYYTQIQAEKNYNGDGTDFNITGEAGFSLVEAIAVPYQTDDWTGKGTWHLKGNIDFTQTTSTTQDITISGITMPTGVDQAVNTSNRSLGFGRGWAAGSTAGDITISLEVTSAENQVAFDFKLLRKPSWAN